MKIINPTPITTTNLVSSNAVLSDYPLWVMGTNYLAGDRVYYQPMGAPYPHDYEAIQHVSGPEHNISPDMLPDYWLDLGASNRYKMFDGIVGTFTSRTGTVDVTVSVPTVINSAAFFNLRGSELNVTVTDDIDGLVYDRTILLQDNLAITSWYAYFFEPIIQKEDVVLTDLPNYRNADIRAWVDAGAGMAQVGEAVFGTVRALGITNFNTSVSIQDYSRKERDQFGNVIVAERRFTKLCDYDVTVQTAQVSAVQAALAAVRAMPVVFVGDEMRPETVVYGILRNFRNVLSSPTISDCTIEVEGLV